MFGGNNKPGFGATNNTGGSLFGGTNNANTTNTSTGTGFGGFGATNTLGAAGTGDPPGTGGTPFQAFTEKEANSSSNQTNSFQNLIFQDPYKKWSAEELRLADYVQGRRHGNASGAGAFGVSSGFGGGFGANTQQQNTGGFGATPATATGGGLFGTANTNTAAAATSSGFGQAATGGFGNTNNNAGSGLFGAANKPAGGLFGGNAQPQQSGGLFGNNASATGFGASTTNTTGAFGATNTNTNTAGGLFGAGNQPKPQGTGFSFGNTATNTAGGGLFGNNAANNTQATGGLFGNNAAAANNNTAAGGLFGNNNAGNAQAAGGLFGNANSNSNAAGGGLFGNNQAKPATGGLFGSNTAAPNSGGGLFGNAPAQQQNTAGFGAAANAGGGLFGAKPTTGSLFGASTTAQNTAAGGTGLFGGLGSNNQAQQATGNGMFGSANQQQKPSMFGNSTQAAGGGLFGGQNTQNQGSSLFGGSTNNQQQQGNGLGGSFLGNSQQSNNAPQGLTANLNDVSAYGSPSLFSSVGGNEVPNPGPLATPLNGGSKPRRTSILPMYKLAPASASRFSTPQKRGFGFSYSSYGTPGGSPASITSTPSSLGRSLLGASNGGGLSKSMSVSNLRRSYNTEDSILAPGAFSSNAGARWYGSTGSKKLVINRDIRSDLFTTPQKDKPSSDLNTSQRKLSKRVSFDTSNVEVEEATPVRPALPAPEDTPGSQFEETPRQNKSSSTANGSKSPDLDQAKGKELTIVHEEDTSATPEALPSTGFDNAPGRYWMQPSREELQSMNRVQRQKIDRFTVGRENVGSITFKVPVDISAIDLDELCGGIIQLEPRSATVYPIAAKKPPVGKGLNVPARISLEQSWPRGGRDKRVSNDPKRFNKHVERLKRIVDTTFVSYDMETGVWIFGVEHFTTYGLDDDDDSDEEISTAAMESTPSPVIPKSWAYEVPVPAAIDDVANERRGLPGTFDQHDDLYEDERTRRQSFLGDSSADSAPQNVKLSLENEFTSDMDAEYDMSEDEDMTRSSVGQHLAAEHDDTSSEGGQDTKRGTPGGILRARMRAMKDSIGPVRLEVADGDDWMEMLRKTVSPVKRDRHILREENESPSRQNGRLVTFDGEDANDFRKTSIWGRSPSKADRSEAFSASTKQPGMDQGRGFATSIDLMNSLFEKPKTKPARQNFDSSLPSQGFPKVGSLIVL